MRRYDGLALGLMLVVGVLVGSQLRVGRDAAHAQDKKPVDVAKELAAIKGELPDQAHAMSDVSFHFANLWFAASKRNWELAEFYLSETRSHLHWAVRIKPVRKDPAGQDIRLTDILQGIENAQIKDLQAAIKAKDAAAFEKGYYTMLDAGCYACHKASGKAFLRLGIPRQPPEAIVRFEPGDDGSK